MSNRAPAVSATSTAGASREGPRRRRVRAVKPLVYYIDRATPVKVARVVEEGVEDWQPASKPPASGNAIIAKIAPTARGGPRLSPEDVRNSFIRGCPPPSRTPWGRIFTTRDGRILNAPIQFYHKS